MLFQFDGSAPDPTFEVGQAYPHQQDRQGLRLRIFGTSKRLSSVNLQGAALHVGYSYLEQLNVLHEACDHIELRWFAGFHNGKG